MINPNELRIGNLVKYAGEPYPYYPLQNGIVEVDEILQDGVNLSQGDMTLYQSELLEGIPLTPEWLQRLGFRNNRLRLYGQIFIAIGEDGGFLLIEEDDESVGSPFNILNYVHQLQNIYFALTGEELTIK